jgi:hypothetical protein
MYTLGSGDSPTSRRRSGRRRRGIARIAQRRGGSRRSFRNRLANTVAGDRDGPSSVWCLSDFILVIA